MKKNIRLHFDKAVIASHNKNLLGGSSSIDYSINNLSDERKQGIYSRLSISPIKTENTIFSNLFKFENINTSKINTEDFIKVIERKQTKQKEKTQDFIPTKKEYRLNRKKIMSKAYAFSTTEQAKKFLAFYSISFPQGLDENKIYKVFNIFLTNLRRKKMILNYLWVAEYQGNGTVHYHMLTTEYMDIKIVNKQMSDILERQYCFSNEPTYYYDRQNKIYKTGILSAQNYNGVDVERVVNSDKRKLIGYLIKYISKQDDILHSHLPWHCSRSVSALFTSITISEKDLDDINNQYETQSQIKAFANDYCIVYAYGGKWYENNKGISKYFDYHYYLLKRMNQINSTILKMFKNGDL